LPRANLCSLFAAIQRNTNLLKLTLAHVCFRLNDFRVAIDEIATNHALVELDVQNTNMNYNDFDAFCDSLLRHNNSTLKKIRLLGEFDGQRGLIVPAKFLQRNKSITHVTFFEQNFNNRIFDDAVTRFCNDIQPFNYTICSIGIHTYGHHVPDMTTWLLPNDGLDQMCARNADLLWTKVHAMIFDIVIALAPLNLSIYVLLWIIDWLPHLERAHAEVKKVRLIESVMNSIRKVKALSLSSKRHSLRGRKVFKQ
jgi:hypothetical protein